MGGSGAKWCIAAVSALTLLLGCQRTTPEPPVHLSSASGHGPCCPVSDPTTWNQPPVMYTADEPEFEATEEGTTARCRVGMHYKLTDEGYLKTAAILVRKWGEDHEDLTSAELELRFASSQPVGDLSPGDRIGVVRWVADAEKAPTDSEPLIEGGAFWLVDPQDEAEEPTSLDGP